MTRTEPAHDYRILVEGAMEPAWSECLAGLVIVVDEQPGQPLVSVLSGMLPDQAALYGVLNTLYMLNLPILLVERRPRTDQ